MSSAPSPTWSWSSLEGAKSTEIPIKQENSFSAASEDQEEKIPSTETPTPEASSQKSKQKRWPPRQCRICLEVVQPTFEPMLDSFTGFNPVPKVSYISAEEVDG